MYFLIRLAILQQNAKLEVVVDSPSKDLFSDLDELHMSNLLGHYVTMEYLTACLMLV